VTADYGRPSSTIKSGDAYVAEWDETRARIVRVFDTERQAQLWVCDYGDIGTEYALGVAE